MSIQIIDSGASLKIVNSGVPKFVLKSTIKTVEVTFGTLVKIDIGKGALYNFYVDQAQVTSPSSTDANDLRDKINTMLQPVASGGSDATAANQVAQTTELQNIKNSIATLNSNVTALNSNVTSLNSTVSSLNTNIVNMSTTVNTINDKVFYEPSLVDETEGSVVYKGYAQPGTSTGTPQWAIQKVTNTGGNLSYQWASGTRNFDKLWDNRRSYTYS